jgi:ABC-type glycerol-3-phosphate transport system permease component
MMTRYRGRARAAVPTYIIFLALSAAIIYPLLWMVMTSLKARYAIFQSPMGLPQEPNLDNYGKALVEGDFKTTLMNSMIVTVPAVFLLVLISALASYAFARLRFRGQTMLFYTLLIGVMVAPQSIVIPVFQVVFRLGLLNTFTGVILVYLSWSPVAILILTTFFRGIPHEIFEAAQVDGAGVLRTFFRIAMPLAKPALATVAIFYFVWIFNDLLYPLVLLQDPSKATIPLGLLQFQGQYRTDWGTQTAALTMAVAVPVIIYMFAQDKFVRGLTAGAVK